MNSKKAKQYAKREILRRGMEVVRRVGRLYIVKPVNNFTGIRYWGWAIATEAHENLAELEEEFKDSLGKPDPNPSYTRTYHKSRPSEE